MTASKIQHPKCLFTPYGSGLRLLCMTIEKGWQEFIYAKKARKILAQVFIIYSTAIYYYYFFL